MTWVPLESKMLLAAAYEANKRFLYLRFHSGDVYRYFDFPEEDFQLFLLAESKGQFFLRNIRNCFRYERIAKLRVA
jgi:hypothetical protein